MPKDPLLSDAKESGKCKLKVRSSMMQILTCLIQQVGFVFMISQLKVGYYSVKVYDEKYCIPTTS